MRSSHALRVLAELAGNSSGTDSVASKQVEDAPLRHHGIEGFNAFTVLARSRCGATHSPLSSIGSLLCAPELERLARLQWICATQASKDRAPERTLVHRLGASCPASRLEASTDRF